MSQPPGTAGASAAYVLGTGGHVPARTVSNAEAGAAAGVTDEWIARKTGVRTRHRADAGEATSDLAVHAGRAALRSAGLSAADLSYVVVATSTPDSPQPPTASATAAGLGAPAGTAAFDVNAVCSGFVFALTLASGLPGYGLVVGADVYSRILDPGDRRTAVLFGDGAGAVALGPHAAGLGARVLATRLAGYAEARGLIGVPAGGSRMPATAETVAAGLHHFTMDGRGVREFVREQLPPAVHDFLRSAGHKPEEVDHFVPHQPNLRMLEALSDPLRIPHERTWSTTEEYANTGAAAVPLTLDRAARSGRVRPGDLVLLAGFGGGMALGLALLRW
ncbi:3-oxoacyl-ACP synthase III family protein [Streptomyces xiaopingdaonensis]|uniref:3-oxoacyl-ACP synthase III family protein n=1 Tax=Streptomyces xiaopingdaonensis TaxID=1565415 RepID=UPI0002FE9F2F|nr:ketoacyl-ACP synthase III [Streptomyces xiaopingdaonensis]